VRARKICDIFLSRQHDYCTDSSCSYCSTTFPLGGCFASSAEDAANVNVPLREVTVALPERPIDPARTMNPEELWIDPAFLEDYPSLYSFLCDPTFSSGRPRMVGGLTITTKFGVLIAYLNDHQRGCSALVKANTWSELLFKMDDGIGKDSLDWKLRQPQRPSQTPTY